jgi:hypothetical protein
VCRLSNSEYGCYLPTRDVTAAPYFPNLWKVSKERYIDPGSYKADVDNLKLLLFFAGGVRHEDKEYSGGRLGWGWGWGDLLRSTWAPAIRGAG